MPGDPDDDIGARIDAELDRIAAYRREHEQGARDADPDPGSDPNSHDFNGHDPP